MGQSLSTAPTAGTTLSLDSSILDYGPAFISKSSGVLASAAAAQSSTIALHPAFPPSERTPEAVEAGEIPPDDADKAGETGHDGNLSEGGDEEEETVCVVTSQPQAVTQSLGDSDIANLECPYTESPPPHNPTTLHSRIEIHRSSITYSRGCLGLAITTLRPCAVSVNVAPDAPGSRPWNWIRSLGPSETELGTISVPACPAGKCTVTVRERIGAGAAQSQAFMATLGALGGVADVRIEATIDGISYHLQEMYGTADADPHGAEPGNGSGSDCTICLSARRCVLVLPCRHLCLCRSCAEAVRTQGRTGAAAVSGVPRCPICRAVVQSLLHIHTPGDESDGNEPDDIQAATAATVRPPPLPVVPGRKGSTHSVVAELEEDGGAVPGSVMDITDAGLYLHQSEEGPFL
ncbi:hypothetical protein HDU87_002653 [Geranomyces variabilis]|uniref:RING-type domain-containing protein n=1 Tax=Geranomyces variabilis TaxID=109894 RepID=A0AAD5TRJ2_9FUNG|nr:hypothetical protein HDU87_002653 [Geranomyces variabilis]